MNKSFMEDREFELGGKHWKINPMRAVPAKELFYQHVRPCLSVMGDLEVTKVKPDGTESNLNEGQIILGVIGRIPQVHLKALSEQLVHHCLLLKSKDDVGKYFPVRDDMDAAFANLKISDLTILDARLFAVNFGESVSDLIGIFRPQVPVAEADDSPQ